MMVTSRSRGLAMVRAAMMPGMAQAKLDSSGMNERPTGPRRPSAVEQEGRARQVARLLQHQDEEEQDHDLRQEHQHAAEPAITPSTSRLRSQPLGSRARRPPRPARRWPPRSSPSAPRPRRTRPGTPGTAAPPAAAGPPPGAAPRGRCGRWPVCGASGVQPRRSRMPCTAAWSPRGHGASARTSPGSGGERAQVLRLVEQRAAHRRRPHATVRTTGTPSSRDSASGRCRGRASRPGRPCSAPPHRAGPGACTASTRRRLRRRLVASTTQTTRSGRFSPRAGRSSTSR
jgi:hypothetical protein